MIDEQDLSLGHKSPLAEATRLMRFLMERGVRVILFCKVRCVSLRRIVFDMLSRYVKYANGCVLTINFPDCKLIDVHRP